MDSLITAAAQALNRGDPLGALRRVALREDAPALALRGIAMAQLGDLERARLLLKRAARAFGTKEVVPRARCIVAQAEIALASRNLDWPARQLEAARKVLEAHGDRLNAAHARHIEVRRLVLIGRLDEAEQALATLNPSPFPPASRAAYELVCAGIAVRRLRIVAAREALAKARNAASHAGIPALATEVENAYAAVNTPAAHSLSNGTRQNLLLDDVEALLAAGTCVVDAFRYLVRVKHLKITLATRPVLFALIRALAEAWPLDVNRSELIMKAFRGREADESHRARLRVEIARLRKEVSPIAAIEATQRGFVLKPLKASEVVVLTPLIESEHGEVLAFLADGESWSSSSLALALGQSQRTVQRALEGLAAEGRVQPIGRGRACRWTAPMPVGFTTTLLLPDHCW